MRVADMRAEDRVILASGDEDVELIVLDAPDIDDDGLATIEFQLRCPADTLFRTVRKAPSVEDMVEIARSLTKEQREEFLKRLKGN
jgi:hypothetical protein